MSKVWSFAGLRLGWAVTKSPELRRALLSHRDYNLKMCIRDSHETIRELASSSDSSSGGSGGGFSGGGGGGVGGGGGGTF